ncbi:MAG: hypothetical protein ACI4EQ_10695 [Lachnospiraceae bacterium]
MELNDILFTPHSDAGIADEDTLTQHKNFIENGEFTNASALLDDSGFSKGCRASFFNSLQNKIRRLQLYLLNEFVASSDEFYSDTEPTEEEMNGKTIWIKPWN